MSSAERSRRYRLKQKRHRFGIEAAERDGRGRHGNHARSENHPRWSGDKRLTSHGYVAIRVPLDFPHAWGPPGLKNFRYCYEHVAVMVRHIGRPLAGDEIVHHVNGTKTDNRLENLRLMGSAEHAKHHAALLQRDLAGRLTALPKAAA